MKEPKVIVLGDFVDPEQIDIEGALTFKFRAGYIEKTKLWKSKDISAEFLGNFWMNILDTDSIKSTVHFICAELLENAVYHSVKSDYLIMIQLCFRSDELMVYVRNSADTGKMEDFKKFARSVLEADNLQKMFIKSMKKAKKSGIRKSQVGLITILKDRGAKLSWKLEQEPDVTLVTTLARISLKGEDV